MCKQLRCILIYCYAKWKIGRERGNKFVNIILIIVIIIYLIISIVWLVFKKKILTLLAYDFDRQLLFIVKNFTWILIEIIIFIGIDNIFTSYWQDENNFIVPGLISLPQTKNSIVIM